MASGGEGAGGRRTGGVVALVLAWDGAVKATAL